MKKIALGISLGAAALAPAAPAWAQMPMPMQTPMQMQQQPAQMGAQRGTAEGEVTRVVKDTSRVTVKHGPIKEMGMTEGMTMVFQVRDKAMLDKLAVGDKIKFVALRENGAYFMESFEPAGAAGGAGMTMEAPVDLHAGH